MRSGSKRFFVRILAGSALFALGFDLFLLPNDLNAGGISGLSMLLVRLLDLGSVGLFTALLNLPLFAVAGFRIGKRFFTGSLLGMAACSVFVDLFARIPAPQTEPLVGALYGGVACGFGLGTVFAAGASTGGSDILVRLVKQRWQNVPIGSIAMCFDLVVVLLTGIVFRDISRTLYSGITVFLTGQLIDAMVYRFDYSRVALIVSRHYVPIAQMINAELERGVTYLNGEGCYTGQPVKVILTALKKQQLAELKRRVSMIDPEAFVIVQEAHQVLGDGFSRYSKDLL